MAWGFELTVVSGEKGEATLQLSFWWQTRWSCGWDPFICLCLDQLGNQVISRPSHRNLWSDWATCRQHCLCSYGNRVAATQSSVLQSAGSTTNRLFLAVGKFPPAWTELFIFTFCLETAGREATNSSPGFSLIKSRPQECAAYESVGQRRLKHFYPLLH